jgi:hypothetical protein
MSHAKVWGTPNTRKALVFITIYDIMFPMLAMTANLIITIRGTAL